MQKKQKDSHNAQAVIEEDQWLRKQSRGRTSLHRDRRSVIPETGTEGSKETKSFTGFTALWASRNNGEADSFIRLTSTKITAELLQ